MLDSVRSSAVDRLNHEELERCRKAYEAGVTVAVPAALYHCLEYDVEPPRWLLKAALQEQCDLLRREKSKKRGRSVGGIARYRQDKVDFIRWDEVYTLREHQERSIQLMKEYPSCPSPGEAKLYAEEVAKAKWLGHTWKRLYECASEQLEATEAFGCPDSIKRSWLEVNRNNRHPHKRFRYCLFPRLFVDMLGFEDDLGYGHSAKVQPWRHGSSRRRRSSQPTRKR
jgi:hypothetical protein